METKNEFIPKKAILPGSVLKLELEEREIKQKDFAREIGLPASNLNEYIHGKRSFTADFSLKLEQALKIPADIWMNLQQNYDITFARKQKMDIEEQTAFNDLEEYDKIISVNDLTKRLGITSVSWKNILNNLKSALNLKPAAELQVYANDNFFKKSPNVKNDHRMILTWTLLSKAEIQKVEVSGVFDISKKEQIVNDLKSVLHENVNTINRVHDILSKNGIKFCIVEKLDSTPIDGYSFYDDDNNPCIVVTKRRDKIDNFAFAIMHELGHLFLHLSENTSIEFVTLEEDNRVDKYESEADKFASDSLIPENIWKKSPEVRLNQYQIQKKYSEWADDFHLNKWIVLGRIGHDLNFWKFKEDATRRIL